MFFGYGYLSYGNGKSEKEPIGSFYSVTTASIGGSTIVKTRGSATAVREIKYSDQSVPLLTSFVGCMKGLA